MADFCNGIISNIHRVIYALLLYFWVLHTAVTAPCSPRAPEQAGRRDRRVQWPRRARGAVKHGTASRRCHTAARRSPAVRSAAITQRWESGAALQALRAPRVAASAVTAGPASGSAPLRAEEADPAAEWRQRHFLRLRGRSLCVCVRVRPCVREGGRAAGRAAGSPAVPARAARGEGGGCAAEAGGGAPSSVRAAESTAAPPDQQPRYGPARSLRLSAGQRRCGRALPGPGGPARPNPGWGRLRGALCGEVGPPWGVGAPCSRSHLGPAGRPRGLLLGSARTRNPPETRTWLCAERGEAAMEQKCGA